MFAAGVSSRCQQQAAAAGSSNTYYIWQYILYMARLQRRGGVLPHRRIPRLPAIYSTYSAIYSTWCDLSAIFSAKKPSAGVPSASDQQPWPIRHRARARARGRSGPVRLVRLFEAHPLCTGAELWHVSTYIALCTIYVQYRLICVQYYLYIVT